MKHFWILFIVVPFCAMGQDITGYQFWFDQDDSNTQYVDAPNMQSASYQLQQTPPNAPTDPGQHQLHVRFKDTNGRWSAVVSRDYWVLPGGTNEIVALRYWSDQALINPSDMTVVEFDPPVTNLSVIDSLEFCHWGNTGLHDVYFQLKDSWGQWSSVTSKIVNVLQLGSPDEPEPITASSSDFCPGDTITLTTGYQMPGIIPTSYIWSAPTGNGWSYIPSNTSSITLVVGTTQETISVLGSTENCGTSPTPATLTITPISPPVQPGLITGDVSACAGTSVSYQVPIIPGLTYSWNIDNWGYSGIGNPVNTSAGTVNSDISVIATNVCGDSSPPQTSTIVVETPPNAGMDGSIELCSEDTAINLLDQLNGNPDVGGTWSGPSPVNNGLYDPGTMTPGDYTYTVSGNICPDDTANVDVIEPELIVGGINGPSSVIQSFVDTFYISPVIDAAGYNWILPSGWSFSGDPDTTDEEAILMVDQTLSLPNEFDTLCVEAFSNNPNCVGDTVCFLVTIDVNSGISEMGNFDFRIAPNPAKDQTVIMLSDRNRPTYLEIYSGLGLLVDRKTIPKGVNRFVLNVYNLATGIYSVSLFENESSKTTKPLIIAR